LPRIALVPFEALSGAMQSLFRLSVLTGAMERNGDKLVRENLLPLGAMLLRVLPEASRELHRFIDVSAGNHRVPQAPQCTGMKLLVAAFERKREYMPSKFGRLRDGSMSRR
jgi:hypothetical protein